MMAMKAEKLLESMRFRVYRRPLISGKDLDEQKDDYTIVRLRKRVYITISYDIILLILHVLHVPHDQALWDGHGVGRVLPDETLRCACMKGGGALPGSQLGKQGMT
jgi:hypothetical protein